MIRKFTIIIDIPDDITDEAIKLALEKSPLFKNVSYDIEISPPSLQIGDKVKFRYRVYTVKELGVGMYSNCILVNDNLWLSIGSVERL